MSVDVIKCENGHFFDRNKYEMCPHCGARGIGGGAPAGTPHKSHFSFGEKEKKNVDVDMRVLPEKTMGKTFGIFGDQSWKESVQPKPTVQPVPEEQPNSEVKSGAASEPYYDAWKAAIEEAARGKGEDVKKAKEVEKAEEAAKTEDEEKAEKAGKTEDEEKAEKAGITEEDARKNRQSVEWEAEHTEYAFPQDKTIGFFSSPSLKAAKSENAVNIDPVVGWLVCIKGPHFGESFPIVAGRNSVGRSTDNKVSITKDNSISREKHAWITYEPKKREFYVQPGESSGLSYLNDDTVMESRRLAAKDKMEFGSSAFLMIPLCGEDFSWEDYIDKE